MTILYVANCTKQNRKVNFRLDFDPSGNVVIDPRMRYHRSTPISAGKVTALPGVSHKSQAHSIMQQLEKYGARNVSDLNSLPNAVVPYLMSEDAPISPKSITIVLQHNNGIKLLEGKGRREAAAIAASAAITNAVSTTQEAQEAQRNVPLPEIEILQNKEPNEPDPPGGVTSLNMRIDPGAIAQSDRNSGRRGRRANS